MYVNEPEYNKDRKRVLTWIPNKGGPTNSPSYCFELEHHPNFDAIKSC